MSLLRVLLVAVALIATATPTFAADGALAEEDDDITLADTHFGLHLGGNLATAGFGTGALVAGIHNFALLGSGSPAPTQVFFLGLTLTSLGAASIISAATGAESNVRYWRTLRGNLEGASGPERRIIREMEAVRLKRLVVNRAIGLAADGTFLGIGIALTAANANGLGVPLVLNGAFILGLDIFKLIVDDQVTKAWEERAEDADAGYFTRAPRRSPVRVTSWGATPFVTPDGSTGGFFALSGTF